MKITKKQAVVICRDYFIKMVTETITKHFENCPPEDTLPNGGYYLVNGDKKSDYWFFPYPDLCGRNILQVGGDSHFIGVNKNTGVVTTTTVSGE